jgi:hypothetical protein
MVPTLCNISRNVPDDVLLQVGTGPQQRLGGVIPSCSCLRGTHIVPQRRGSHGRRIGVLSDAGQLCSGVSYVSIDLKAGPYQHITIVKAARKYVSPFALAPLWLHLELFRHILIA